jgi:hypothetical protein
MTDSESNDGEVDPIYRELIRIFGDDPPEFRGKEFLLLPLVNGTEFLALLRTVPAGTSLRDLTALAAGYRTTRPLPRDDAGRDDPESAV